MPDAHANFARSTVATAPSPATSGTSLVVAAGEGALMPTAPFNAVIWPVGTQPSSTNAEIVRVTAVSTDTLTITRAQESTSARTVIVGDQIHAGPTKKWWSDIEGGRTTFSDANYTVVAADRVVATAAGSTLTGIRTVTLPAANAVPAGWVLTVIDSARAVNGFNVISVARAGSDTIDGASTSLTIGLVGGAVQLVSDGSSAWSTLVRYQTPLAIADGGTNSATATAARTALGVGTGDSPQFTAVNIGNATDTTVTRTGAGDIAVEGNALYRAGGTDVPIADGGTGASTAAAAADALLGTGTRGDLPYRGASAVLALAKGTSGQFLKIGANDPAWASIVASDVGNSYRAVGSDVALTTKTNPTALISLLGATLSFPTVAVGDMIEVIASGTYTNSQNASTLRLNLLLSSGSLFDYTTPSLSSSANARRWYVHAVFVIKQTGAVSGRFEAAGMFVVGPASTSTFVSLAALGGAANGDLAILSTDTQSFDLSAAGAIDLQTLIGTSSSTATVALRTFKINHFQA